ncbi:hypothetical protein SAY86_015949 [Trapa natans]|uniref:EF-hand domain-containing protein n=1 Tax=Trapa natans TaxID=22666 RepID=A0AAN7QWP8_TRANT|nr:hypothetical protein SAY86_015817 [Trapa natans]KAK4781847.1 hypothetical protein SAY86_015949 [Trapa natans]
MTTFPASKTFKWVINIMSAMKLSKFSGFCIKRKPDLYPSPRSNSPMHTLLREDETLEGHGYLEAFRRFDGDGDGKVSSEELSAYFAHLGDPLPPDQVRRLVIQFDSDGDCLLGLKDFVRLLEQDNDEVGDDIRRAFEMYEEENSHGCITPDSLQRMLGRLGDRRSHEECVGMIRAFDLDGNGVLDLHEFQLMMMS